MAEGQTSLNIREAKKEDLQQLARIANIAFREDSLYAWLFPYRNSTRGEKDFLDWKLNLISSFFYSGIAVFYVAEGIRGCPGFEDGKDLVIGYVMLEWHLQKQLVLRSWTSWLIFLILQLRYGVFWILGLWSCMDKKQVNVMTQ